MTGPLAGLFTTAIELTSRERLFLMLPLCLSIAIVYKTTRCDNLREVPASAFILWVTIVVGMFAVGGGLWLFCLIMV